MNESPLQLTEDRRHSPTLQKPCLLMPFKQRSSKDYTTTHHLQLEGKKDCPHTTGKSNVRYKWKYCLIVSGVQNFQSWIQTQHHDFDYCPRFWQDSRGALKPGLTSNCTKSRSTSKNKRVFKGRWRLYLTEQLSSTGILSQRFTNG